ncbi:MAG: hypothetical protein KKB70_08615 [Proteobacteria bacterium]|nr:hypothetical protein [Pseudomonadota bacterium]MBU1611189.1 hypothetical protein [Pseudomonadota bacterium]
MQKIDRYLIVSHGDVDPEIRGPFVNDEEVVTQARAYRLGESDDDGLFRLNVIDGKPEIHTFCGGVLEDPAFDLDVPERAVFENLFWMDCSYNPAPENNNVLIGLQAIKDNLADGYDFGELDISQVLSAAEAVEAEFINVRYVGSVLETIPSQNSPVVYVCDNCGETYYAASELDEIDCPISRLSPGDIFPNGQCPDPDCGAFVYEKGAVE